MISEVFIDCRETLEIEFFLNKSKKYWKKYKRKKYKQIKAKMFLWTIPLRRHGGKPIAFGLLRYYLVIMKQWYKAKKKCLTHKNFYKLQDLTYYDEDYKQLISLIDEE